MSTNRQRAFPTPIRTPLLLRESPFGRYLESPPLLQSKYWATRAARKMIDTPWPKALLFMSQEN